MHLCIIVLVAFSAIACFCAIYFFFFNRTMALRLRKTQNELCHTKTAAEAADRLKKEFCSNISHELRTPMTAILGFADLLKSTSLSSEQRDYVYTILQSGEVLLSVISDIIDFSKIEANHLETEKIDFDLSYLTESMIHSVRQKHASADVRITHSYSALLPRYFKGDPTRVRQIINNILSNAVKFTPNGTVDITVEPTSPPVDNTNLPGTSFVRISVKDTGVGIPKEQQSKVFDTFYQADGSSTRKYGGIGLGLSIAKKLVEKMGGNVLLNSEEGKGSEFIVTLGFEPGIAMTEKAIQLVKQSDLVNKRIAIVDDNHTSMKIIQHYCQDIGLRIVYSSLSGENALEWILQHRQEVDLCICEPSLGVCMDGFMLVNELRNKGLSGLKCLALAANAMPGDAARAYSSGFDAFCTKPYNSQQLSTILQAIFGDAREKKEQIITWHMIQELTAKGKCVLVVEDNALSQKSMSAILTKMGCTIDIASNGQEAVEKTRSHTYDIIFMDLQMPIMCGIEATQIIRKANGLVPIFAVTANDQSDIDIQCKQAGMNGLFAKPVNGEMLKTVIAG